MDYFLLIYNEFITKQEEEQFMSMVDRLFFEIQKPLPQSLTNVTDFSKVIPTIETFFRVEDPPRRLIKMKL